MTAPADVRFGGPTEEDPQTDATTDTRTGAAYARKARDNTSNR
jgi:hypothetical protein